MASIINMIRYYDLIINSIDSEIISIMFNYTFFTSSIKGIDIVSAASIVSKYVDFSLFSPSAKVLSFDVLNPSVYKSVNFYYLWQNC